MTAYETLALLLTIAGVFAYVNHRWIHLPPTIGLMALGLAASVLLILIDRAGWVPLAAPAARILERIDFDDAVLHGMLGVLLFAGALHVDLAELREHMLAIGALALAGTIVSSLLVAALAYAVLPWLGVELSFGYCLLFGTLISPTDPIGVLGILKQANVPRALKSQIAGESLFNDGVGVVAFLTTLAVVTGSGEASLAGVAVLFLREAVGGALFGLVTGYVAYRMVRSIDHYQTELLVTLALVLGGYALAERLHVSAPIAAVVAGLLMGNQGRALAMSDVTRDHLDKFWSLADEVLNAILFVLVGFEIVRIELGAGAVLAGVAMIPAVLVARLASVAAVVRALGRLVPFARGTARILTWGGLRGGISVALALSIPAVPGRDLLVTMTYFVVVFSVLVQGLTLGRLVKRLGGAAAGAPAPHRSAP